MSQFVDHKPGLKSRSIPIFLDYLKENEFGFETIAYKGYEDPPQILDMIKNYIDHNKMFEQAMNKKIGMFYKALNWGGVEDTTTSMSRFF